MKKQPTIEQAFNAGIKLGEYTSDLEEGYGPDSIGYIDYDQFLEWFEKESKPIPFDLELYNTGKYDIQTRTGRKAIFIGENNLTSSNNRFVFSDGWNILMLNLDGQKYECEESYSDVLMVIK